MPSLLDRLPKFDVAEEDVVSRQLVVDDGRVAVLMRYADGLEVTLHVEGEAVWFEANRDWTRDMETGVMRFGERE